MSRGTEGKRRRQTSRREPRAGARTRREFLKLTLGAGAAALASAYGGARAVAGSPGDVSAAPFMFVAQRRTLTVATWGGATEKAVRDFIIPRFERDTGAGVVLSIDPLAARYNKILAQRSSPVVDVMYSSDEFVYRGLADGVIETLDPMKLSNAKDLYPWAFRIKNTAPCYALLTLGLGYHTQLVKDPPRRWADLWDPRWAGRLAVPSMVHGVGPAFLVKAAQLAGGSQQNIDPGFRKLAELRPVRAFVLFTEWEPLLQAGDFQVMSELDLYIYPARDRGLPVEFVVPEDGLMGAVNMANIVKGTRNRELAEHFINLTLDPVVQAGFASLAYYGPTNTKTRLPATVAQQVAYGDRLKLLQWIDWEDAARNRARWIERFNAEVLPRWR
jgi:putative spermidine/putrescine transport system substrate-binding protein